VKRYRRFQILTPYFYCMRCDAGTTGPDAETEATAHADEAGHEVRVVNETEAIVRPAADEEAAL
jgi:hypothetical protein